MRARFRTSHGSTSLVALVTISTLAFVAGSFIVRMTSRSRDAYHSASWIEASQAAESAAALGLAEIRRVLPATNVFPADAWSGWQAQLSGVTSTLPLTRLFPANLTLSLLQPVTLAHAGEGNTSSSATVSIDAPATLIDATAKQWYRIRATGTTGLPGSARASLSMADRTLRRLAFVRDWSTGRTVASPQVSRNVEWIVRPAPPFSAALQATGLLTATDSGNIVDSYDSGSALKSTGGEYDSAKRQLNGSILTNNTSINLNGHVFGSVSANSSLPAGVTVTGAVSTSNYQSVAPISAPDWGVAGNQQTTVLKKKTSVSTNSSGAPAQYHYSSVSAALTLKANTSHGTTLPSKVEIWIDGDLTGSIIVENGVQATVYIAGNINVQSSDLQNPSLLPANLQIYGIQPASGASRSMTVAMNSDLHAAIYAPGHDFTASGTGDLMGSFTARTLSLTGARHVHFDEALLRSNTPVVDYRLASWVEDVPAN